MLIIFYYGVIHALGPDHLSAITLFSIGKKKYEALLLSFLFALGHGITLFLLSLIIQYFAKGTLLHYGDMISSVTIILMGLYLVYLAITNKICINQHHHDSQQHTHIYYKNAHFHDKSTLFTLGLLMGAGGVRGALITLSIVSQKAVGAEIIIAFILGVSSVFLLFGYFIYLLNNKLNTSKNHLRYAMFSVGVVSLLIGIINISGEAIFA